ncbi:uncharacterized protein LOC131933297 isoform X2 [Physella acuta]|nr:uncharacterized protein LOC131933297 isoform X2 [Physella acuta]
MYANYKSSLAGTATAMKGVFAFKQLKPNVKPKAKTNSRSHAGGRVMISYSWAQKEIVLKIRDELDEAGISLWFDEVNMEGSTLEAMAEGILGSDLILICMSESYFNSQNCRSEAEYAYKKKRKIIPLILERGYKPQGWLDFLIGSELYLDFTQEPFDEKAKKLKSDIKSKLKKISLAP